VLLTQPSIHDILLDRVTVPLDTPATVELVVQRESPVVYSGSDWNASMGVYRD